MSSNYPTGSEWRRWDLHVHSPASDGFNGSWDQFEKQLQKADCDVIGINDYCSVAGYKMVLEKTNSGKLDLSGKIIFPVVEFRMRDILKNRHTGKSGVNINFHVIFSNEIDIERIETFIKSLTVNNSQIANKYEDPKFLKEKAAIGFDTQVLDPLSKDPEFAGKFLIWLPYDEYGGIDDIDPASDDWIKRDFIKKSDLLGSSTRNQIDFFLWRSPLDANDQPKFSEEQFRAWFKSKKACIKGSDSKNHKYPLGHLMDSESKPIEKYCWIKADPTFEGLKRVVREPEERVYVGLRPPKLTHYAEHSSKYIHSISIAQKQKKEQGVWFDNSITLNSGLVAIIGKKGSGKSALADIIALSGRTHIDPSDYSFLKTDKFRKGAIAKGYSAEASWADGSINKGVCLNENVDIATEHERVRYLPQVYVDRLCNEVGVSDKFQAEINNVVFSYLSKSEKQGASSLSQLIQKLTGAIEAELLTLRAQMKRLIDEQTTLETKLSPAYKERLQNGLKELEKQRDSIQLPKEIKKPSREPDKETNTLLKQLKSELLRVDKDITSAEEQLEEATRKRTCATNIQGHIKNLKRQVADFRDNVLKDLKAIGLSIDDVVTLSVEGDKLKAKLDTISDEITSLRNRLGNESETEAQSKSKVAKSETGEMNLKSQKQNIQEKLSAITKKLSSEQKAYEAYLATRDAVEKRRRAIEGTKDDTSLSTITSISTELKYLEKKLPVDLAAKKTQIQDALSNLFAVIESKCSTYQSIYKPLRDFVDREKERQVQAQSVLTFDVGIVCRKEEFASKFLSFIDQGRIGSFRGRKEGRERIVTYLQQRSFRTNESVSTFIETVMDALEHDKSSSTDAALEVNNQLVANTTKADLLKWMYGLEYLDVQYKVQFNGKDLNAGEFSPGERGAILLIFYLLIDKENTPLIIDQPEENLDNESVFSLLVPYIKRAKQKRQVIIVTHNPNLAVVCDAEQIVCASMDKSRNEIRYTSGSIENPSINRKIIDILEGTMPAFRTRDDAYQKSAIG